jgi:hypothetical protein
VGARIPFGSRWFFFGSLRGKSTTPTPVFSQQFAALPGASN